MQFTLNSRVWRNAFFGHARGMDDLFWRSILWTVRKPFAANMIPPFVAMSWDDCEGRHDFAYADIAVAHGYVPMPSLFVKQVPERLFPKIRAGLKSGKIQYNTHALDYYRLLVYNFGKGECSEGELEENFRFSGRFLEAGGGLSGSDAAIPLGGVRGEGAALFEGAGPPVFLPGPADRAA